MSKFSFASTYKEAEKTYGLGKGEYLKIQEGDNKIRLISECVSHSSAFKGKPTFKFLCQVLDRKDGKIKPYFMPVSVYKVIESLQLSEEYAFDEVPMPYDLNITAVGAGSKEVKYSVIPARQSVPLTEAELALVAALPPVRELQKKIFEKQGQQDTRPMKEPGDEGHIDVEEIPF